MIATPQADGIPGAPLAFKQFGGLFILQCTVSAHQYNLPQHVVCCRHSDILLSLFPVGTDGLFIGGADAIATEAGGRCGAGQQQQQGESYRVTSANRGAAF
jgi:hypothetical protein